jgi:uncharacterized protein YcbK (DUF882 family)
MTVKQRQLLLAYLGYYVGIADDEWGTLSKVACAAFQTDFGGITVDGYGGRETDKALKHAVAYDMFKVDKDIDVPTKETTGSFWDEIEYFTRDEFRCQCGGKYCDGFPAEPKEQLVRTCDKLRKNLGVPITIVSGLRCPTWNQIQGGVADSQHMYGEAADIYAAGKSQLRVETELDNIGGVRYHYPINGSSNVHFDIPKGAR